MTKKISEYFMAYKATKLRIFYAQRYYRSMHCRRKFSFIVELKIFKFRVSEMPFPGLWGSFDRILMVRKQPRFSMSKFTIYLQFSRTKVGEGVFD